MNQAIFEEILIEVDGSVVYARMAQPFAAFHDEEFRTWVASYGSNPGPFQDRGSNIHQLVEVKGLEPSASTLRKYGFQTFGQAFSENFPGSGVAIPSGLLTIPAVPSR